MNYELLLSLLFLGGFVGVMAGLLGIGGGLIVVPALLFLLPKAGITADIVMHLALATSLASIIITSGSSALNHLKLGNVSVYVIKWLLPGVVIGGLLGSYVTELIPVDLLPKVFGFIVLFLALQMLLSVKSQKIRSMPSPSVTACSGCVIGVISTLAGIGGGSLTVPYLSRYGVEMRRAIGSSSVCGCVIAISGMAGFIWHGTGAENLPEYSIGYVYVPALLAIVSTSMFTTKIGARLATNLPTAQLKKVFAVFLLFIAGRMLLS
ncbi:sulfite exporter TauE/SafE family protein [Vibrio sp. SCSIO 43137]|uniref:sulfite exporter TauE/SafE family protein n=1 Tax=Vibrio sp. SCSIO 43137 TaxID=3021011 RepID=UPI002307E913|nr:sulfite exporter TauE/SafE family protein [Vibrio sp. SCSIO 43137]WCE29202.1 sulfite exporter TauE/SafE family protein [Vibrio sp. SCSIO 43137]